MMDRFVRSAVLLTLVGLAPLGAAHKPKPPKPSACAAEYFCVTGVDWFYVQNNVIHGYFENRSNAMVTMLRITFTMSNGGTINGSAEAGAYAPIPANGRMEFTARIMQTTERYDSVVEAVQLMMCADLNGNKGCGTEHAKLEPPLFGPAAWGEKRAWMRANGY